MHRHSATNLGVLEVLSLVAKATKHLWRRQGKKAKGNGDIQQRTKQQWRRIRVGQASGTNAQNRQFHTTRILTTTPNPPSPILCTGCTSFNRTDRKADTFNVNQGGTRGVERGARVDAVMVMVI